MKKIIIIGILISMCLGFSSCNDEWEEELYTKMVSFKAPVGSNGIYDIYMRYKEDGTGQYKIPVILSGSQSNKEHMSIVIGVDNDTLNILNNEKFASGRTDLWYKQLPEKFYSFPSTTCEFAPGEDVKTYTIDFNLKDIDLSEKWVLPLTIVKNDGYVQNTRKGWNKALLGINLFNDYSGWYSSKGMNIYIDGSENDPATEDTRQCRVVDDRTVFFYAGTIWDEDVNRGRYKVMARFEEGTKNSSGDIEGKITLYSGDPENKAQIEPTGNCSYIYQVIKHPTKPYLERRITTMYLDYKYTDFTTSEKNPTRFHAKGNMSLERQYNTLIPDEEQAILW